MGQTIDSTQMINEKFFREKMGEELLASMKAAAEPIIQKALKEAEEAMRKDLAAHLISKIESDYDIRYRGSILEIRVRQADRAPNPVVR